MKSVKVSMYAVLLMLLIGIAGCFSGSATEDSKLTDANTINPALAKADAVYNENVKHLENVAFDGENIIVPAGVVVGDIVTFNYQGKMSAKKIVSIEGTMATLGDAELEEIFSKFEMKGSIDLTTANLDSSSLPSGVVVKSVGVNAATGGFTSDSSGLKYTVTDYELINYNKFSTPVATALKAANVSVKVNGSVLLKKPTLDYSCSLWNKSVKLAISTGDTVDLSLTGNANYEKMMIDKEIFLGNYIIPLDVMGVSVGNITFSLTMSAGVNGKVNFYARAYQSTNITVGVQGKYGESLSLIYPSLTELQNNSTYSFTTKTDANLDAWCALMPRASLAIFSYEMAAIKGELGVQGNVSGTSSLAASAKLYAKVDVDYTISPTVAKQSANVLDWSKTFVGTWTPKTAATITVDCPLTMATNTSYTISGKTTGGIVHVKGYIDGVAMANGDVNVIDGEYSFKLIPVKTGPRVIKMIGTGNGTVTITKTITVK